MSRGPYRFCPDCGRELEPPTTGSGARCASCGRSWYRNSVPAVGAVIVRGGRALVTVRGREPERGRLDIPGGFLEAGEHPLEGLRREVREELGVEVAVGMDDLIDMAVHRYGPAGDLVLAIGFRARLVSGEPRPSDDVADLRWLAADEVEGADFAWPHDRAMVRATLAR